MALPPNTHTLFQCGDVAHLSPLTRLSKLGLTPIQHGDGTRFYIQSSQRLLGHVLTDPTESRVRIIDIMYDDPSPKRELESPCVPSAKRTKALDSVSDTSSTSSSLASPQSSIVESRTHTPAAVPLVGRLFDSLAHLERTFEHDPTKQYLFDPLLPNDADVTSSGLLLSGREVFEPMFRAHRLLFGHRREAFTFAADRLEQTLPEMSTAALVALEADFQQRWRRIHAQLLQRPDLNS